MFKNLRELIVKMPDEKTCRDYLIERRWKGKPICPYCKHENSYVIEGGKRFKCASSKCYKKYSVTVGTVMEDSNIPLTKWLTAIYLVTAHKKGISSYQLGKDVGVMQRHAWFMMHRIREMMKDVAPKQLGLIVEADVTFIGGKISNKSNQQRKEYAKHQNPILNKTSVLGMVQRDGNLIMKTIPKNEERFIDGFIRENVEFATSVITDEGAPFAKLNDIYYHYTIQHQKNEYARMHLHTNSIEGVFSHFKRMVYGIYHKISRKHTQRYLDEFSFRFNSRKMTDSERFSLSFENMERRLDYRTLIATTVPLTVSVPYINKKIKAVIQRLDDEIIAEYPSMVEAEKATGIYAKNISSVIRGRMKKAGGFQWEYASGNPK